MGLSISHDLTRLEEDVKFMLEMTLPDGPRTDFEVTERFKAWRTTPQYPIHKGLFQLVSEFYIHALKPDLGGASFFKQRNSVLKYLNKEVRGVANVRNIGSKRWSQVAAGLCSLMQD